MSRLAEFGVCLVLLLAAWPVRADELTGTDKLICAANTVVLCLDNGECESVCLKAKNYMVEM